MSKQRWLPLESNPDVLNKYGADIGLPDSWQFTDVYSLDDDTLGFFSQAIGVMVLFPCSDNAKKYDIGSMSPSSKAYFTKQTIGNACGTVAMIHCLANTSGNIKFVDGKPFSNFLSATRSMNPADKAAYLENDSAMGAAHGERALEGQTEAPPIDEKVTNHFVALVPVDGELIELDGRQTGPVSHGKTSPKTFIKDAAAVVKKFMERDPGEVNFTVLALVPS